jgi:hypothetical protein
VKFVNRSLIFSAETNNIEMNNSSSRKWAENTARLGELRNSYKIFVANYEVEILLSRSNRDVVKFQVYGN